MEKSAVYEQTWENYNKTATDGERPCPGNWTAIALFIHLYNPHYFENRPRIICGLFTLGAIGLVSNCSVLLYKFLKPRVRRSAFTVLVMQLALADGLVCIFCLLGDAVWNVTMEWTGGTNLCRFVKFMQMFSLYASTMTLTGMTLERCITVTFPFTKSRPKSAMYRAKVISIAVWSLATLCSIPQAMIFHVERAPICTDFFQCVTFGAYSEPWQEVAYTMSSLCILFLLPLVIIIACYVIIFAKISQEAKIAAGNQHLNSSASELDQISLSMDSSNRSGRRMYRLTRIFSLWTTFVIAIVFVLCWAPYYISMIAYLFQFEISNGWMTVILSFGMTSTVLNPVIYGVFKVIQSRLTRPFDRNTSSSTYFTFSQKDGSSRQSQRTRNATILVPLASRLAKNRETATL